MTAVMRRRPVGRRTHDQWPYAALAGVGIGFILAPASTDAVNRSIGAPYGEVTGITQTVRNFAAGVGLAVLGTVLTHVTNTDVVNTLEDRGLPPKLRTTSPATSPSPVGVLRHRHRPGHRVPVRPAPSGRTRGDTREPGRSRDGPTRPANRRVTV